MADTVSPHLPPIQKEISLTRARTGVHNLDAHQLFYLPDPTLAFLLLHAEAIPWPFSEMQARAAAAYWSGSASLDLTPHHEEDSDSHSVLVLGHPGE